MSVDVITNGAISAQPFLIDDPSIWHGVVMHCLDYEQFCGFLPLPHFLAEKEEIACMLLHNYR
jgi:hypothetical protein